MCGIVAAVSRHGASRARRDRSRHAPAAASRAGRPAASGRRPTAAPVLGHARLSIIDLETGDQPIVNEDGRLRIVVNGELYDFERIRCELERDGHTFRTRSDSEIALHLFEDRGAARAARRCAASSRFAIWDERDRPAVRRARPFRHQAALLHDPRRHVLSGVGDQGAGRPRRAAALGSRYAVRHPLRVASARSHAVRRHLPAAAGELPADRRRAGPRPARTGTSTIRRRTRRRRSATNATWIARLGALVRGGGPAAPARRRAGRLLLERRHRFLRRARRRVAPLVAADPRVHAVVRSRRLRRRRAARATGGSAPAPSSAASTCASDDLADHFTDAIYQAERPFANAHAVAKFLLSRAVRDSGIKVVLTGEGSDEIFAGYPHFRRDLVLYGSNGHDPAGKARLLAELEAANRVSAGTAACRRERRPWTACKRVLGLRARRTWKRGRRSARACSTSRATASATTFADRDTFRVMLGMPRRRAAARRPARREPVALHLEQDHAAQLHPEQSGRSDGDGALGRGPAAVPRSSRRRGGGADADLDEDQRDDGEVRAARGGARRC